MRHEVPVDIDPAGLAESAGPDTYARGVHYLQQHAVVRSLWSPSAGALVGTVRGGLGNFYTTTARFRSTDGVVHRFERGECSCPVGFDCKHVVALVLSAADPDRPADRPDPGESPEPWERALASLLDSPARSSSRTARTPLAIALQLSAAPRQAWARAASADPEPCLLARLVRPGKHGWVAGGLSWTQLGNLRYSGEHHPEQVRLLRELYALYSSAGTRPGYAYYSYGEQKTIDLSAFESAQLWPLLDEADRTGLRLVHERRGLGTLDPYGHAELSLDVTRADNGMLTIAPVICVDDAPTDAVPIVFIGTQGHGLVYADRADTAHRADLGEWPLRLAKLARPAPPRLQRLALDRQRLDVPATDHTRFRDEYYPRLRHLAAVISTDGCFTPPAISDPTLVLRATYGPDHNLELAWDWVYEVGDSRLRAPLYPTEEADYRDLDVEREIVADLDVGLEELGLRCVDADQPLAPRSALTGIDTMRFSTQVLPLLDGHPGVVVETSGEPADYREAGDSVRIGVSTDEVAGETDWFDLAVTITVEGRAVPFTDIFVALSRNESHLLLADGAYFSLEKPQLQSLRRLIEEAQALQDQPDGPPRISRFQAGLWSELAELGVVDRQAQAWQQQVGGLLAVNSVAPKPRPGTLSARLRPYQADGFGWLAFLWEHRLGGILADDMGLGKTLQSLALICHATQTEPGIAPFLVVAPTSVVANWAAEASRFAPGLTVVSISDTLRRRDQRLDEVVAGADVVVTSYTLFRLDFDAYAALDWSGLLLDEAQFVKNHRSKAYQCARRLPAPFKLAITGTPMENNLMELWSLLSITAPGLFPSPTRFRDFYAGPIERRTDSELLAQLRRRIKPLVKRRTKEQVAADLPAKQEQVLELELHPRHRTVYQRHLQRERQKVLGLVDDLHRNRFTILRSLTLLRRLSLHAGLVDSEHRDLPSIKVDALLEQLRDVTGGEHRALVFSQFTGFLDLVRARLDAEGVDYCYLDGKTRNRAEVIQRFKTGSCPVFLISLKAGGFGLNLTEADYCFLLDPWWNPATEAQAVDRTHRIGQTRNVMVYRLIAKDTIEEKVMALKARKAELFSDVMDDGNAFGANLDAADIRGLFE
ncbi:MAG: DEAD/DEAH box helicase [Sporichthyaceae bacterium]|nr:DEAD/DEAH box helicase [Sporichthyaceae bacterium]